MLVDKHTHSTHIIAPLPCYCCPSSLSACSRNDVNAANAGDTRGIVCARRTRHLLYSSSRFLLTHFCATLAASSISLVAATSTASVTFTRLLAARIVARVHHTQEVCASTVLLPVARATMLLPVARATVLLVATPRLLPARNSGPLRKAPRALHRTRDQPPVCRREGPRRPRARRSPRSRSR